METTRVLLVVLLIFAFTSCANPRADYEEVQKIQDAAEQIIQRTADYDIRIKSCDDAITALQNFLAKHKEGEWSKVAESALASWKARKATFDRELSPLTEQLSAELKNKAIEASKKVHPASNIEHIDLGKQIKSKAGDNILLNETYSVRVRGAILGTHIFKLLVHVSGGIMMDTKKVFVDDSTKVEE